MIGTNVSQTDIIKKAEQYLEAHVRSVSTVRHAAATQGLLSSWGLGEHVQAAALVIPLIREYVLDEESLGQMFGERTLRIAKLAMEFGFQGLNRLPEDPSAYFLRKLRNLYICAYTDIESALLCAADHLASTVHFDDMTETAYRVWASETLAVDVPLLEMLGMWKERQGMADLALHLHDAGLQEQFEYYISTYYLRHDETYLTIRKRLALALRLHNLRADIQMHETTPASLYRRYKRSMMRGQPFNPSDPGILRVEIQVEKERDCYYVMGMLHSIWQPSATTPIKDWIASPRYNGFRALITTVNVGNEAVEFRILTHDMADVNARGVLTRKKIKNAWWTKPELARLVTSRRGRGRQICVFSPAGEIYILKQGSTVVDFAFRVHSELGPYAKRFFINGRQRTYNAVIQHCDIVEIQFDQSEPSVQLEWENVAKTGTARTGIRRHLRGKPPTVHPGRAIIDQIVKRESRIYDLYLTPDWVTRWLEDTARERRLYTLDELYTQVASGNVAPDELVAQMIDNELKIYVCMPDDIQNTYFPDVRLSRTWMQQKGTKKFQRKYRITPRHDIVGELVRSSSGEATLIVHQLGSDYAPSPDEAIPLAWTAGRSASDAVEVTVTGTAKAHVTLSVMNEIQRAISENPAGEVNLYNFQSQIVNGMTQIEFKLDTTDRALIASLEANLSALRVNNLIKSFKIWEMMPGQHNLVAGLVDRRQRNPYTPHHIKDTNMFFGRGTELERVLGAVRSGITFIILHGDKRIGKTSMMYHLADHVLPQDDHANVIPVLFDTLRVAPVTAQSFAEGLIDAAAKVVNPELKREYRRKLKKLAAQTDIDPMQKLVDWVQMAEKFLQGQRILFLVDEFTAVEEASEYGDIDDSFFHRMHHIVDRDEVAFLLCIHNHVLRNLTEKIGDMNQRGLLVPIDILDPVDARALVRTPVERFYTYEEGVEDRILYATNRHPFYIHSLCSELFTRMSLTEETNITHDKLSEAIAEFLKSGFHRFAHYKDAPGSNGREVLEVIASLSGYENDRWATLEQIQETMKMPPYEFSLQEIERVTDALHEAGALHRSALAGSTEYKIRIPLLHKWSIMGTSLLAQSTVQRT